MVRNMMEEKMGHSRNSTTALGSEEELGQEAVVTDDKKKGPVPLSHAWFMENRNSARGIIASVVLTLLVVSLIAVVKKANADDFGPDGDVIGVVDNDLTDFGPAPDDVSTPNLHRPQDTTDFMTQFKNNKLSHMSRKNNNSAKFVPHFSKSFKATYMNGYVQKELTATTCTPDDKCWVDGPEAWQAFDDNFYWSCMAKAGIDGRNCELLGDSAHWQWITTHTWDAPHLEGPGNTTLNIVWCAGLGIATFYTGGSAAAAAGPVATGCLGSWLINH